MSVSPFQYVYRGKLLCHPRDLDSVFSVIVHAVQELYDKIVLETWKGERWAEKKKDLPVKGLLFVF